MVKGWIVRYKTSDIDLFFLSMNLKWSTNCASLAVMSCWTSTTRKLSQNKGLIHQRNARASVSFIYATARLQPTLKSRNSESLKAIVRQSNQQWQNKSYIYLSKKYLLIQQLCDQAHKLLDPRDAVLWTLSDIIVAYSATLKNSVFQQSLLWMYGKSSQNTKILPSY